MIYGQLIPPVPQGPGRALSTTASAVVAVSPCRALVPGKGRPHDPWRQRTLDRHGEPDIGVSHASAYAVAPAAFLVVSQQDRGLPGAYAAAAAYRTAPDSRPSAGIHLDLQV